LVKWWPASSWRVWLPCLSTRWRGRNRCLKTMVIAIHKLSVGSFTFLQCLSGTELLNLSGTPYISGISRKLGILAHNPAFQQSYGESIPAISQHWWILRILRLDQLKLYIRAADPSQKDMAISDTSVDSTRINTSLIFYSGKVFCLWFPRFSCKIVFGISGNTWFSYQHRKRFEFAEFRRRVNF
jgi:hypothetical protein